MARRQRTIAELEAVTSSNGAPSARNLLVTVFGDALLPHGAGTSVSVRSLGALLASFGVSERLVRTSLTRLVNERLLTSANLDRRSYYAVAPGSLELFADADLRIYAARTSEWDGQWTLVVIDANEGTPAQRAQLRQELAWIGFGSAGPNVMASPLVPAETAAHVVERIGGFDNVLVSRSTVVPSPATLGPEDLAHRVAELDAIGARYEQFMSPFTRFDETVAAGLTPELAFKLRTLLIAGFRRVVLTDPQLPQELLPADWIGRRARSLVASLYDAVADASEQFLVATVDPPLEQPLPPRHRMERRPDLNI